MNRTVCRLLVVGMFAALLQIVGGSPAALAAPGAPKGLSPSAGSSAGSPVLQWSRVGGASRYDVQLAQTNDFSNVLYSISTTNSSATPTQTLPSGSLFWRVRGVSDTNGAGAWAKASFNHSTVGAPTLQQPVDGATLQQPGSPPTLTWQPVVNATSYQVEVDTDDQFVGPQTFTVSTESVTLSSRTPLQPYFWHVRANLGNGLSTTWSAVRSFSTIGLANPTLRAPANNVSTPVTDAVLDWNPVVGAVSYELRVSPDDQFNTITDQVTVKSTRYARTTTYNNDQYWWQVRSIDIGGNRSPWSEVPKWQFKRAWPDKPTLLYPANGATGVPNPFYYEWSPVHQASFYQLDVGPDGNFSPGTYQTCTTRQTTYTARFQNDPCAPNPGSLTYWRVRAQDDPGNVNGIYSSISSFTFDDGLVTQVSPVNGPLGEVQTVDVPTVTWEAAVDAVRYEVKIKTKTGAVAATTTTNSLSWTPPNRLSSVDGPFHWTVASIDASNHKSAVPIFGSDPTFQVSDTIVDSPAANLAALTPAEQHTSRFPSLAWEPYFAGTTPADHYQVWVGVAGSQAVTSIGTTSNSAITDTATTYLSPGHYRWFVQAYDASNVLIANGPSTNFWIDNMNTVNGQRLSLTGTGLTSPTTTCSSWLDDPTPSARLVCTGLQQTPVLRWNPVPQVGYYMVYLSRDRELTNQLMTPILTSNTMWTPTDLLPDSQAGDAYYWFVRPCKTVSFCAADPTSATNAFDKRSNPVGGLVEREHDQSTPLPDHGPGGTSDSTKFADEITLSWSDYLDTNALGSAADSTNSPSTVEARTYRIQIAANPDFNPMLVNDVIDQASYSPFQSTLPEGPIYWRVQAIDGSGNGLSWSLPRTSTVGRANLVKRSATPQLTSPNTGATVSAGAPLVWEAAPYAASYEVEIYKNGDQNLSLSNRVLLGSSNVASFSPGTPLPPGGSPYVWRVRRFDADNRPGDWSSTRSFTISGTGPVQVSPASGSYVSGRDALFSWQPVAGAASYRFDRRPANETLLLEAVQTVGLDWATPFTIIDGAYEWRVVAFDRAGGTLGSSPWRTIRVDSVAPRVISKSPKNTAPVTSNFVVKFSEKVKHVDATTMRIYVKGTQANLAAVVTTSNGGKTATLNPKSNLRVGKIYTVTLSNAIKDRAGIALKPTKWTVIAK